MPHSHVHEWTLVLIHNEPVGASCECGETRGMPEPDAVYLTTRLDAGTLVQIGDRDMVVESISMNHASGMPTTADVVFIDSAYFIADRYVDRNDHPGRMSFPAEHVYELGSYTPIKVI